MVRRVSSNLRVHAERNELVITRMFNAPRELVFKVYTDPNLVPLWWGPRKYTTRVEKMEVRPGGQWRFVQSDENGSEFAFHGEYLEIVPPERVVYTFVYEGDEQQSLIETVLFEESEGRTKMTAIDKFSSLEGLQNMLQEGMESGMNESFARLDELLKEVEKEPKKVHI
jgi:uncharacterized protein YndB with AHSA1/START domain